MIKCIFTIDYEIFGNGTGSLKSHVFEPAEKLKALFQKRDARFVVFVEAAEMEMIRSEQTDPAIGLVERQIREFYKNGFEIGLHVHPQWYNAQYKFSQWHLDYNEYNLCCLTSGRINRIIDRSIEYLRICLGLPGFEPLSFRSGNWILQPTTTAAHSLSSFGIKIDSSVFKGGKQHRYGIDYQRSCRNGHYWRFSDDVNIPNPDGRLIEIPIFSEMVPTWRMSAIRQTEMSKMIKTKIGNGKGRLHRLKDHLRIKQPVKFDFCTLPAKELIRMFDQELKKDRCDPSLFRPIVAIGHTKNLVNFEAVESFLSHAQREGIQFTTFKDVYAEIIRRAELT